MRPSLFLQGTRICVPLRGSKNQWASPGTGGDAVMTVRCVLPYSACTSDTDTYTDTYTDTSLLAQGEESTC